MHVHCTSTMWIFVPMDKHEHGQLVSFCKSAVGKSHGVVSVWYTQRVPLKLEDGTSIKPGIVVKNKDLALQIILVFGAT